MASEDRSLPPALTAASVDPLLLDGQRHAFFQALRLLRLRHADEDFLERSVRIRPALSLSFPDRDIEAIERDDSNRYRITANFFGLYGVTSPLPVFYTEDLINQVQEGNHAAREFLDILHAALYPLLFRAWEKNRLWLSIAERNDDRRLNQLLSLVGLGSNSEFRTRTSVSLLPHAGNFNQFPRSALGLQSLIAGLLADLAVDVEPCVIETISIPAAARCKLGEQACILGEDALLGSEIDDRAASMRVHLGPMSAARLAELLPGTPGYAELADAIALYLKTPLRCVLVLHIDPRHRPGVCLGESANKLGLNTWLPETAASDNWPSWPRYDEVFLPIDIESHITSKRVLQ